MCKWLDFAGCRLVQMVHSLAKYFLEEIRACSKKLRSVFTESA